MPPSLWVRVNRLKPVDTAYLHHSEWKRRIGIAQSLGVAAVISLPLGTFILIPHSVQYLSGPSTMIGVLFAFVVSMLAGLHLSELGCAVPRACAVYAFTYAAWGECWAFAVGWLSLLDRLAAVRVVAHAWSRHANLLFNASIHTHLSIRLSQNGSSPTSPLTSAFWSTEFDTLSVFGLVFVSLLLCLSLRVAGTVSVILVLACSLMLSSAIVVGFFHANPQNWIRPGFFSNGRKGVFESAGLLLYGFIGAEAVLMLMEETSEPRRKIPVVMRLVSVLVAGYFFLSTLVVTLGADYTQLAADQTLPDIFASFGLRPARYIVTVSSLCGLSGTLLTIILPASRTLAAMGVDRLLCKPCASVSSSKGAPTIAILVVLLLTVFVSSFVRSEFLFDILSVGYPLRLLLVAIHVFCQHYRAHPIGLASETAKYRKMRKRPRLRSISSVLNSNGSVVSHSCSLTSTALKHHNDDGSVDLPSMNHRDVSQDPQNTPIKCKLSKTKQHFPAAGWEDDLSGRCVSSGRTSDDDGQEDDGKSFTSSALIRLYCNAGRDEKTALLITNQNATASLSGCPSDTALARSLSKYRATDQTPGSTDNLEQTDNGKHDCRLSPCSRRLSNEDDWHMYEQYLPELPYYDEFDATIQRPLTPEDMSKSERRANRLLVCFLVLSLMTGLLLNAPIDLETDNPTAHSWVLTVVLLITVGFICLVILVAVLSCCVETNSRTVARRSHKVPAFPTLSLCTIFLLVLLLTSARISAYVKLGVWLLIGVPIYFMYGYRKSNESKARIHEMALHQQRRSESTTIFAAEGANAGHNLQ